VDSVRKKMLFCFDIILLRFYPQHFNIHFSVNACF